MKTKIPFIPKVRLNGEEVDGELYEEILKLAVNFNKNPHDFSARIELLPDPESKGHYVNAEVEYNGELTNINTKDA